MQKPTSNCPTGRQSFFTKFSDKIAHLCGSPYAFLTAFSIVLVWGITGPMFDYSDTWQLVINTGTTIITFLMVFIIQQTQNRDIMAVHLKLDELLRSTEGAHNALLNIQCLSEEELEDIRKHYKKLADSAREALRTGGTDTNKPEVKVDFGID